MFAIIPTSTKGMYFIRPATGEKFRVRLDPSGERIYQGFARLPAIALDVPEGQTPVFELVPYYNGLGFKFGG